MLDKEMNNQNEESTFSDNGSSTENMQEQTSGSYILKIKEKLDTLSTQILVWGIISLAVADLGGCLSFLGIIFSRKVNKLLDEYNQYNVPLNGKAKIGRILAKVAFIIGLVVTLIIGLYFLAILLYCLFNMLIIFSYMSEF